MFVQAIFMRPLDTRSRRDYLFQNYTFKASDLAALPGRLILLMSNPLLRKLSDQSNLDKVEPQDQETSGLRVECHHDLIR